MVKQQVYFQPKLAQYGLSSISSVPSSISSIATVYFLPWPASHDCQQAIVCTWSVISDICFDKGIVHCGGGCSLHWGSYQAAAWAIQKAASRHKAVERQHDENLCMKMTRNSRRNVYWGSRKEISIPTNICRVRTAMLIRIATNDYFHGQLICLLYSGFIDYLIWS